MQLSDIYSKCLYDTGFRFYYSPEGDGNCFPRCILRYLTGQESEPLILKIRDITATNLLMNEKEYDKGELQRIVNLASCVNINHYCTEFKKMTKRLMVDIFRGTRPDMVWRVCKDNPNYYISLISLFNF